MRPSDRIVAHETGPLPGSLSPPVDVDALAAQLGATTTEADQGEDGLIDLQASPPLITLRSGLSATKRRFTLAHELGHLLLHRRGAAFDTAAREERLCDEIAAGLLMPADWVGSEFTSAARTLATVRELAMAARVSEAAALLRLNEIIGWRASLVTWERDPSSDSWHLGLAVGLPNGDSRHVRTSEATNAFLRRVSRRHWRDVRVELPVQVRKVDLRLPARVTASRNRVSALLLAVPYRT